MLKKCFAVAYPVEDAFEPLARQLVEVYIGPVSVKFSTGRPEVLGQY